MFPQLKTDFVNKICHLLLGILEIDQSVRLGGYLTTVTDEN